MDTLIFVFEIYIAIMFCVKVYIFFKCRKQKLGCQNDSCRLQRCCSKHISMLSPLDRDIYMMREMLAAIEEQKRAAAELGSGDDVKRSVE